MPSSSNAASVASVDPASSVGGDNVALDVAALVAPMLTLGGANFTYEWRLQQLRLLYQVVVDHFDDWTTALHQDLGKSKVEAVAAELLMVKMDLDLTLSQLKHWMTPTAVPSPGVMMPCQSWVEYRPLAGAGILIIGPCNYPVSLTLQPLVGALAAGNPAVLKPSELTPNVAQTFARLIPQYFSPSVVQVVLGGISETTALLNASCWGKIFFTGSVAVGKIVATAAAQTLTPVVLELGGKCPAYVDEEVSVSRIQQVADRIVWSKLLNAGQTCAATDTVVIHEKLLQPFVAAVQKSMMRSSGRDKEEDEYDPLLPEMGRIATRHHTERLYQMIVAAETTDDKAKVVYGGSKLCRVDQKFIYPTVICHPSADSALVTQEIFGPILSIVTVRSRDEAIDYMNRQMPGTALCLYVFCDSDRVFRQVVRSVPAGSVVRNDALLHLASPYIPFGGLGTSGYGHYHGRFSFECFSHALPVVNRHTYVLSDLCMARYPPFGDESSWKSWQVRNVVVSLPAVPVIRPWRVGAFGLALAAMAVPSCREYGVQLAIRALELLLSLLKKP
jgi:acyl-CoA reductase-like NAD-dependent aldehyde dehydrogenase